MSKYSVCCVIGCKNKRFSGVQNELSFFYLPSAPKYKISDAASVQQQKRLDTWIKHINKSNLQPNRSMICSIHFVSGE
jgi:hypothetical protein